ncbi:S8 family peptidase [Nonomuraea longicatena]|uniref:Peptidase S8/S53 domain-containing protein n=1 Tax=Nonomuraea longicatena TaxID=83682 RepID=A0ABN1Q958_9ACTN
MRKSAAIVAVLASVVALTVTGAVALASAPGPEIAPGLSKRLSAGGTMRVIVTTRSQAQLSAAAASDQVLQRYTSLPMVVLRVDKAGLDRLSTQPDVVSVVEDKPEPPVLAQSVPLIGADKTRAAALTGKGTAVAVLDTGVAVRHPFLGGRVIAEACFSPSDPEYAATSLCPNGTDAQEGPGSADSEQGRCATLDCAHGTHVAGIIAGRAGVSGSDGPGVAPEADIVAMQIFSRFESEDICGMSASPCVLSFTSAQLAALEKVHALHQSGVPIVAANLSLGSGRYSAACDADPRKAAIDRLLTRGVATVVAAGNNGFGDAVSAPACVTSAVAVGSTTDTDEASGFSNRGALLDVFAPGTGITSSVPGGRWAAMSGTSMAAPHVAGAFAVLRQTYASAGIGELEAKIKSTGKAITYPGGSTPRLQLKDAALGPTPTPTPTPTPKPTPPPDGKHWVDTFGTANGYPWTQCVGKCPVQGKLYAATNYVFCKIWGDEVRDGSGNYNRWWLLTDLDRTNPGASGRSYVSAYYLSRWGNDEARDNSGAVIPDCTGKSTGKHWVDTFADAIGYSGPLTGATMQGQLNKATNYVFCKKWGAEVRDSAGNHNRWWLLTDLDRTNPGASGRSYVSAYYLSRWGNNEARDNSGAVIPDCS